MPFPRRPAAALAATVVLVLVAGLAPPAAGEVSVSTVLELEGAVGHGGVTWAISGEDAIATRQRILALFDEDLAIPGGFRHAGQPTGATPATVANGIIDSGEARAFLDYLAETLEGAAGGGTEFRFFRVTGASLTGGAPAWGTSGLVGMNATAASDVELTLDLTVATRGAVVDFSQAERVLADALQAVFSVEILDNLQTPECPPTCLPFPADQGWHTVDPPQNVSWTPGRFLWHGPVDQAPWTNATYDASHYNATVLSYDGVSDGWVDLRFATSGMFSFEYTGSTAAGVDDLAVAYFPESGTSGFQRLVAVEDREPNEVLDPLPITTLGTATYDLSFLVGQRIRLRFRYSSDGSEQIGAGYYLRNFRVTAESRYEGLLSVRHVEYLRGAASLVPTDSSGGVIEVYRNPLGEVSGYSARFRTSDVPGDRARYAAFDAVESPPVLFLTILAGLALHAWSRRRWFALPLRNWHTAYSAVTLGIFVAASGIYLYPVLPGNAFVGGAGVIGLALAGGLGFPWAMHVLPTRTGRADETRRRTERGFPSQRTEGPALGSSRRGTVSTAFSTAGAPSSVAAPLLGPALPADIPCANCGHVETVGATGWAEAACSRCGGRLAGLPWGFNYLILEVEPTLSFAWFNVLLGQGAPGLVLSTTFPDKVRRQYGVEKALVAWFSDSASERGALDPKRLDFEPMRMIGRFLADHPGGAILVGGLEHLITVNGLDRVLKFVKKVNDIASLSQATLLVPLSPKSLGAEDLSRLRKEFDKAVGPSEAAPQAVVA